MLDSTWGQLHHTAVTRLVGRERWKFISSLLTKTSQSLISHMPPNMIQVIRMAGTQHPVNSSENQTQIQARHVNTLTDVCDHPVATCKPHASAPQAVCFRLVMVHGRHVHSWCLLRSSLLTCLFREDDNVDRADCTTQTHTHTQGQGCLMTSSPLHIFKN